MVVESLAIELYVIESEEQLLIAAKGIDDHTRRRENKGTFRQRKEIRELILKKESIAWPISVSNN